MTELDSSIASYLRKAIYVNVYPEEISDWEYRNLHFDWNVTDYSKKGFYI